MNGVYIQVCCIPGSWLCFKCQPYLALAFYFSIGCFSWLSLASLFGAFWGVNRFLPMYLGSLYFRSFLVGNEYRYRLSTDRLNVIQTVHRYSAAQMAGAGATADRGICVHMLAWCQLLQTQEDAPAAMLYTLLIISDTIDSKTCNVVHQYQCSTAAVLSICRQFCPQGLLLP